MSKNDTPVGVKRGYHPDRFDSVPKLDRVGAHRATERAGSATARFLVAAFLTLLLTATGIMLYIFQPASVSFMEQLADDTRSEPAQNVQAEIKPETTVVVLNGTEHENLALDVDEIITREGWGSTMFSGDAEDRNVPISAVFYADAADEGLAKGLGEQLGGVSFYLNPNYVTYGNQLTVLLGSDYAGPGARTSASPGA